ncbi:hypothetical protein [Streptomyces sp. TRM49041]|uniref:hypothetical protein n=1 Tax=Streptomyces sp. TRM49041 TaxID=2603216 RepID=UPI0011ED7E3C|nr:hypothetical protein [Streptomyces sp. TRM49041]
MSSATFAPTARVPHPRTAQPAGATALDGTDRPAFRLGDAFRAVRVFATAAFGVAVLGEYDAQAAGVKRR